MNVIRETVAIFVMATALAFITSVAASAVLLFIVLGLVFLIGLTTLKIIGKVTGTSAKIRDWTEDMLAFADDLVVR